MGIQGVCVWCRYRCVASNSAGTVQSVALLSVQSLPSVSISPPGVISLSAGAPLTALCTVTGGDPAPSLQWRRIGPRGPEILASSATLSLASVTKAQEGTYSCVAANPAGEVEERLQVLVTEERREEGGGSGRQGQQEPGVHEVHTRIGSDISFNCLTDGQVPPGARAVWTRSSR